jgi:hypothetical protein
MIYLELEDRSSAKMSKIIFMGIMVVFFFHSLIGIFGYATFADDLDQLNSENILTADYKGTFVLQVGNFAVLFSVIAAAPL